MNWNSGTWRNPGRTHGGKHRRVTVTGDWAPIRHYEDVILQKNEGIYGDLLPILRNSSLNIVNLESVLGMHGEPILKNGPNLRGDERAVESLTAAPFQVACLANNHTYDYGSEGLEHTLNILDDHGIQTVGAGLTGDEAAKPLVVDIDGFALGIINYAEGDECRSVDGGPGANGLENDLAEQVKSLKKEADAVIIIFHGGREFMPVPPPYIVKELRKAAAAGASAVIAHHPHVPQGIEITADNVPIAYSFGKIILYTTVK